MKARRAVAVLLSRFPLLTETFILREIEEMERQGQPVRLVPLIRESPPVMHAEAVPWLARALYTPYLSAGILAANLRTLCRDPRRYAGVLGRVVVGTARSPNFFIRTLALFPKWVYLAERLRQEGIGHVHAHFATHPALAAFVVSSLAGIRYSFTVHAHDIFVRRAMLREKIREAAFVRPISRFNRDFLMARYPEATEDKLAVIHAGIDPAGYGRSDAPGGRILCVAALKPYKGLPILLEACRILKERRVRFECDLVGDGPLRARVARLVAQNDLEGVVRLWGPRPQGEVARLMAQASVFVLPSVVARDGQTEGIPVSLMEAMASGRAVVASSLSGIPELVEDGVSGILVEPGQAKELAAAIERLLSDPERARGMGEKGREKIEREFRLDRCVSALLERIDRESEALPAELGRRLDARDEGGVFAGAVGVRRIHERPESTVAELLVSDGRRARDLIFKVQRAHPAAESARREFETLSLLHQRFSGCVGYGVPRPVHLDEAAASLLMERCRGTPLERVIREARLSRDPRRRAFLASAIRRTGHWLQLFQQQTAREADARLALESMVGRTRKDLQACEGRVISPRLAATMSARLSSLRAQVGPVAPRLVGHHADFWPGNVYVDDETVEVIDFEGFREGLPYEDAAYFLVQLELFHSYPLLRARIALLRRAFLEGYSGGEGFDRAAWELCRAAKALQVLAQPIEVGPRSGLRAWWRRRALTAAILGAGS